MTSTLRRDHQLFCFLNNRVKEVYKNLCYEEDTWMLTSIALIFLLGMIFGNLFKRLGLPGLLGMLLAGMLLGPYMLNMLDKGILLNASTLRQLALVIILTRAGLSLNLQDVKQVGKPAILLCFLPACLEMLGTLLLAPHLLGVSYLDALIMGTVLAAVSPAIIVPKMLHLMKRGYGVDKSIPQMIMAGASIDDVFVISVFTASVAIAQGEQVSIINVLQIPFSIMLGIAVGIGMGKILFYLFQSATLSLSAKVLVLLSVSFLLLAFEGVSIIAFSGMLAIMSMSMMLHKQSPELSDRLAKSYEQLWVAAELMLFVLVGAMLDLSYVFAAGEVVVLVIFGALAFRMIGVIVSLRKTKLNCQEKVFCMIAYTPKATVQAAIGPLPLAMGLACGNIVLTVAVVAILITAPLGDLGMELTYRRLLDSPEGKK